MDLSSLGWDDSLANHFPPFSAAGLVPARVAVAHKHAYALYSTTGDLAAECTGRLLHHTALTSELPVVGDWVAVRLRPGESRADIHAVLPRRTHFSRRDPGDAEREQVIAANVDTVFLVTALDGDFNLRRLERYLAVARQSGATAVIILNKADLSPDSAAAVQAVAAIAGPAPVLALSAAHDADPAGQLAAWLIPGRTVALLGSSGAGKSTLTNRLLTHEHQQTGPISEAHGKGRHTTTHRELVLAPSGALLIDTPGLRELQLWEIADTDIDETFAEIASLAARCRFRDCAHRGEPGCAVQAAIAEGALEVGRWESFLKLQRERAYAARKADPQQARVSRAVWKKVSQGARARWREKQGEL